MKILLIISALLLAGCANTEAYWVLNYGHDSDIARGQPFNEDFERTLDSVGTGATIVIGERFEIDLVQGVKRFSDTRDTWEGATTLNVRHYPRGRK